MDAICTSNRAIPDVSASRVSVQLKQLRMVTSDLFLPWKFSMMDSRKQSDGGWSCDLVVVNLSPFNTLIHKQVHFELRYKVIILPRNNLLLT